MGVDTNGSFIAEAEEDMARETVEHMNNWHNLEKRRVYYSKCKVGPQNSLSFDIINDYWES